jgi:hypothetical protein
MSDEALDQDNAQLEPEIKEEKKQTPNTAEDVARAGGWKPKDEYTGNQEDWRSAEVFNERGVWIDKHKAQEKRLSDMEGRFNSRLDSQNKLHQAQVEMQKKELVRKRDDAIDLADRDQANRYQTDLDSLNVQPEPPAPASNDDSVLDTWNASNPWILGTDPKAAYAKQQFGSYQAQGINTAQSIQAMEADVNRAFPDINPARENQPIPEKGSRPGRTRAPAKLSMSDLTSEELKYYRAMPNAWSSDAEYLQAVQDTRG